MQQMDDLSKVKSGGFMLMKRLQARADGISLLLELVESATPYAVLWSKRKHMTMFAVRHSISYLFPFLHTCYRSFKEILRLLSFRK